jgi:hypothetical protein
VCVLSRSERCSFSCAEFWSPSPALLCLRRPGSEKCLCASLFNFSVRSLDLQSALTTRFSCSADFPRSGRLSLLSFFAAAFESARLFLLRDSAWPEFVFSVRRAAGHLGFCFHSRVRLLFVFQVSVESRCSAPASFPPTRFGLCH